MSAYKGPPSTELLNSFVVKQIEESLGVESLKVHPDNRHLHLLYPVGYKVVWRHSGRSFEAAITTTYKKDIPKHRPLLVRVLHAIFGYTPEGRHPWAQELDDERMLASLVDAIKESKEPRGGE